MKLNDLTGKKFGNWEVICRNGSTPNKASVWHCRCTICGNEHDVVGTSLTSGRSTKCRACVPPTSLANGWKGDPVVHIFSGMWQRCYDHNHKHYNCYGGRGISICKEWLDNRTSFYKWAYENGYCKGMSIDRIDNNLGYSPSNCRFIPLSLQNSNKRNVEMITIDGETMCASAWAKKIGKNPKSILSYAKYKGCSKRDAILRAMGRMS